MNAKSHADLAAEKARLLQRDAECPTSDEKLKMDLKNLKKRRMPMLHPVVPRRADLLHRSCAARGNLKAERKGVRKFLQRPTKNYRHVSTSQFFQLPKS
jgi:hypothetical protein